MKRVTEVEHNPMIGYIAGVFDSLGCVKIETPRKAEKPSLYIWVTSKNFILMELLQNFGAYISRKSDGQYRAKWRDNNAYRLLKQILPILTVRKEQARVGTEFLDNRKNDPNGENDVIYRMRLKLLKREEEDTSS